MDFTKQEAHPDAIAREKERELALQLRMSGYSYRRIAEALKGMGIEVSKTKAHALVVDALQEQLTLNRETTEELRALELARLDDIWKRLYPTLPNQKISEQTARTLLRISQQRSVLIGLPVLRPTGGGGDEDPLGDLNLTNLTVEELRTFEALAQKAAGGTVAALGLNPGDEVFAPDPEPGEGVPVLSSPG